MLYVHFPLSLRNVEGLPAAVGGIEFSHETVLVNKSGLMLDAEIRRRRVERMKAFSLWQWHIHEGQRDILQIQ